MALIVAAVLGLAAGAASQGPLAIALPVTIRLCEERIKDQQVAALSEMIQAVNAGDAARYARLYRQDAAITIHGSGEPKGRGAIEQYEVELAFCFRPRATCRSDKATSSETRSII